MKLTDIACGVLMMAAFQICQASDADDLLARTRALKALAADFHEVIEDEDGLELESYDGKLKIKVAGKSFRLDFPRCLFSPLTRWCRILLSGW